MPKKLKNKIEIPGAKFLLKGFDCDELTIVVDPYIPAMPKALVEVTKGNIPNKLLIAKFNRDEKPTGKVRHEIRFNILKADEEKKQFYGYAYVPNYADLDTDAMLPEDLIETAHSLLKNLGFNTQKGTGVGKNHEFFEDVGYLIESAIDVDGALGKAHEFEEPIAGAWFFAIQASDSTWKLHKKGKVNGVSIGGFASRVAIDEEAQAKGMIEKLRNTIAARRGKKADDLATYYTIEEVRTKINDIMWYLMDVVWYVMVDQDTPTMEEKQDIITRSLNQAKDLISTIFAQVPDASDIAGIEKLTGDIKKATEQLGQYVGEKRAEISTVEKALETIKNINDKGEDDMTSEELKTAIAEGLAEDETVKSLKETIEANKKGLEKLSTDFEELKKSKEPEDKKTEPPEEDPTTKALTDLTESVKDLGGRLEKLEKTPALRKSAEGDGDDKDKNKSDTQKAVKGTAFDFEGGKDPE